MFLAPLTIVASEFIPPFTPFTYNGRVADSRLLTHFWRVAGFSGAQPSKPDFVVNPITEGEITFDHVHGPSWQPNKEVFLNGKILSQTPPSSDFIQIMGIAKDSKTLVVKFSEPIIL